LNSRSAERRITVFEPCAAVDTIGLFKPMRVVAALVRAGPRAGLAELGSASGSVTESLRNRLRGWLLREVRSKAGDGRGDRHALIDAAIPLSQIS
jgi:hypothetical protein